MATLPPVSVETILGAMVTAVRPDGTADARILSQIRQHADAYLAAHVKQQTGGGDVQPH